MTTKDKINQAFKDLRQTGYFARQDFWCCQSCAWADIPEEKADKVVFYHHQDNDSWSKVNKGMLKHNHPLYLAWSGDCKEIVSILEHNGLTIEHDGSEDCRIKILPE